MSWRRLVASGPCALTLYFAASSALAHGDLHEQIVRVSERMRAEPENAVLAHKRGELHRAHEEPAEALADYVLAERLDPALDVVHLSRGRVLLETGEYRAALASLSEFLRRMPGHTMALALRARTHANLGRYEEADADFAAAIGSGRDPAPDLFLERARNLEKAGAPARALDVLNDAIARKGALVILDHAALTLERLLKRFGSALARVDRMLAMVERKETLLALRAEVLSEAGRNTEARQTREAALLAIEALPPSKRALTSMQKLERDLLLALGRE